MFSIGKNNNSIIFSTILLSLIIVKGIIAQEVTRERVNPESDFYKAQEAFEKEWEGKEPEKGKGWKQNKRAEYFWEQRLYPSGEMPSVQKLYQEYRTLTSSAKYDRKLAQSEWTSRGPNLVPEKKSKKSASPGIGRINCIAFHPTNKYIYYVGAPLGGVWKTTDDGSTWKTFPMTEFMSIGISDIAVSPTDGNLVYAVTGDADGAGNFNMSRNYSIGVLKTTDGGDSWTLAGLPAEIDDKVLLNKVLIHPTNNNIVYIAANKGIYKTTDGGENWDLIYKDKGCRDLKFKPRNPNVLYGAFMNLTNEKGNTYSLGVLDAETNTVTITKEYSKNEVIRIALGVTNDDPKYIYALCANQYGGMHSIALSTNSGNTWVDVAHQSNTTNYLGWYVTANYPGGQGHYDLAIEVSPTNRKEVFVGGVNIWKSENSGQSFDPVAEWMDIYDDIGWVHADVHSIKYNRVSGVLYTTTDGGVNKSTDDGITWEDISYGLEVSAFYKFSVAKNDRDFIVTGAQDNGTFKYSDDTWKQIYGGDGFMCLVDYTNPNTVYASTYSSNVGNTFFRSDNGGGSFKAIFNKSISQENQQWVTPIEIHPTDPNIIFIGHTNVWKSTNKGDAWDKISTFSGSASLKHVVVAPSDANVIYASYATSIYATYDGGANWEKIVSTSYHITDIEVDPQNPTRFFYTLSGYSATNKVFYYDGNNSVNITKNLPNVPANTIAYQNNSSKRLYVGTDFGVFYSDSPARNWLPMGTGLPNVVVTDLQIHKSDGMLMAATFGRGLWETKVNDCDIEDPVIYVNGEPFEEDTYQACEGTPITLEIGNDRANLTYQWSNDETGKSITVSESGDYSLIITDNKDCSAVSKILSVNFNFVRDMTITVKSPNDVPCEGSEVELQANFGFSEYEWSNGETTRSIYVTEGGEYQVTGTTSVGCESASETMSLKFEPVPSKPTITKKIDTLLCSDAAGYQWYYKGIEDNDFKEIKDATDDYFVAVDNGDYKVEVFNEEGCSTLSDAVNFVNKVDEIENYVDVFKMHPNPTSDFITIEIMSPYFTEVVLSVSDINGKVIAAPVEMIVSNLNSTKIDLGDQANGTYFLNIKIGDKKFVKRIVKQ